MAKATTSSTSMVSAKRSPFLAFGLLVAMMSLAGVPLTAGFLGKFLVFKVAFETQQFFLIALGIINSRLRILLLPKSGESNVLAACGGKRGSDSSQ